MVVSVAEKAPRRRQMRDKKTNANEPLLTCRKRTDYIETGDSDLPWDELDGNLSTGRAVYGMKEA